MPFAFVSYGMGFTVSQSSALQRAWRDQMAMAVIRAHYDVNGMMGNSAEQIRMRAAHSFLRLAGPRGRLP